MLLDSFRLDSTQLGTAATVCVCVSIRGRVEARSLTYPNRTVFICLALFLLALLISGFSRSLVGFREERTNGELGGAEESVVVVSASALP